jgi:hypothetical protein
MLASADRLRADVATLAVGPRSRLRAPAAMRSAERYVTAELRRAGWLVRRQSFEVRWQAGCTDQAGRRLKVRLHRRLAGTNLIASLPAADDGPTVVVGAHLDTVGGSPGADDNASGVAAVLEIGRLLGTLAAPPNVTLAIFDLEELGLIGARVAARWLTGTRRVTGMIGLESVGYFAVEPATQRLPAGAGTVFRRAAREVRDAEFRGDFTLVAHRRSSAAAAARWRDAAAGAGLRSVLLRDPRPDGAVGRLAGLLVPPLNHLGRSDHAAFWNRGVPALMLTGTANFRNARYHRPDDTADTLDYDRLAAVTTATAVTVLDWPAS